MNTASKPFASIIKRVLQRVSSNKVHQEYQKIKTLQLVHFIKMSISILLFSALYLLIFFTVSKQYSRLPWVAIGFGLYLFSFLFCDRFTKYNNILLFVLCMMSASYQYYSCYKLLISQFATTYSQGFGQGYLFGIYERVFCSRFSNLFAKIGYSAACLIIRLVLFQDIPVQLQILHVYVMAISLVIEFMQEKQDRKMFQEIYDYRESLTKFKDLVSSGLSANLLILTRDLTQELFISDPLAEMVKTKGAEKDVFGVSSWLDQLVIEKSSLQDITQERQSVLALLQEFAGKNSFPRSQQKLTLNAKIRDDGGTQKIFEIKLFLTLWDDKDALVLILNDITEHYLNMNLQAADRKKDKMLAMISHELRTPLNGILGVVNILKKDIKEPQQLRYLTVCHNSGELLLNLVNSILDLQQIRDNKFSLKLVKDDINELLGSIYDLFKFQFDQKDLYFKLEISPEVPDEIITDQNRLKQILINLIGNALKFTFKGGVCVFVDIDPVFDGYIHFRISDTGIGMKEEDLEKLFKMYGRLDQQGPETNIQGVGFGLEISNQLAKLLSGNIEIGGIKVESQLHQGTTFSFSIRDSFFHSLNSEDADHGIHYYEPRVFSENIEDIAIKITPYSHRDVFSNDRTSPQMVMSGMNSSFENLAPKSCMPSVSLFSSKRTSILGNNLPKINILRPSRSYNNLQRSRGVVSPSHIYKKDNSYSDFSPNSSHQNSLLQASNVKPKILIVDDNPFNLLVARRIVERLKYSVETALNGELAIEKVKADDYTQPFSAILMDLQMPVLDGFETTKELRKMMENHEIPVIPIIAVSANDTEDDKRKCQEVGMYTHLTKPLYEDLLGRVLNEVLEKDDNGFTFGKAGQIE